MILNLASIHCPLSLLVLGISLNYYFRICLSKIDLSININANVTFNITGNECGDDSISQNIELEEINKRKLYTCAPNLISEYTFRILPS